MNDSEDYAGITAGMMTNHGIRLKDLSDQKPVMLVFLRHFGCVFCKEAMADLAEQRNAFETKGVEMVFVHMSKPDLAEQYFKDYKLDGVHHISDPECRYYSAFGILKGRFSQLYGLRTWIRGFSAQRQGHKLEMAKALGDSTQMPGIFLIRNGQVREKFIHKLPSDRPDYGKLIDDCSLMS
ncbi:MAG: peroxiredoxin-like family protein [Bacteroidota bacterium]